MRLFAYECILAISDKQGLTLHDRIFGTGIRSFRDLEEGLSPLRAASPRARGLKLRGAVGAFVAVPLLLFFGWRALPALLGLVPGDVTETWYYWRKASPDLERRVAEETGLRVRVEAGEKSMISRKGGFPDARTVREITIWHPLSAWREPYVSNIVNTVVEASAPDFPRYHKILFHITTGFPFYTLKRTLSYDQHESPSRQPDLRS